MERFWRTNWFLVRSFFLSASEYPPTFVARVLEFRNNRLARLDIGNLQLTDH